MRRAMRPATLLGQLMVLCLSLAATSQASAITYEQKVTTWEATGMWPAGNWTRAADPDWQRYKREHLNDTIDRIFGRVSPSGAQLAQLDQVAQSFDGQTGVPIPTSVTEGLTSLSIEAWVKGGSTGDDIQAIVSAESAQFVHLQTSGASGVVNAVYLDDGRQLSLPVIPKLTPGWHHIGITLMSGENEVYLDCEQVGKTDTTTYSGIKPATSLFIGKGHAGGRWFKGSIAGVKIWKGALRGFVCGNRYKLSASDLLPEGSLFSAFPTQQVSAPPPPPPPPPKIDIKEGCYTLKNTGTGGYLTHNGGGVEYFANRGEAKAWEKFYISRVGSAEPDGLYSVYGEDGNYLSAQAEDFVHKRGTLGDWETWRANGSTTNVIRLLSPTFNGFLTAGSTMRVFNKKELTRIESLKLSFWEQLKNLAEGTAGASKDWLWTLAPSSGCKMPSPSSSALDSSADNFIPIPTSATSGATSLVVEGWVKYMGAVADIQAIVSAAGPEFVHLQMSAIPSVRNAVYLEDGRSLMLPAVPLTKVGEWHHVALVVESGNSRLYVDGAQEGATDTTSFAGAKIKTSSTVSIGKGWEGKRHFEGMIKDVRIWKNVTRPLDTIRRARFVVPASSEAGLAYLQK